MTILEQINQDLTQLNEQQLRQVAEFIVKLKPAQKQKRRLSDFYAAFPATVPYPGKEIMRQNITTYLAEKHNLTDSCILSGLMPTSSCAF